MVPDFSSSLSRFKCHRGADAADGVFVPLSKKLKVSNDDLWKVQNGVTCSGITSKS